MLQEKHGVQFAGRIDQQIDGGYLAVLDVFLPAR